MESEQQIELIERYLGGRMTADEKSAFEQLLKTDADLHRLFIQHRFFLEGVEGVKLERMTQQLRNQSPPMQNATFPNPLWIVLGLTALAFVVAAIFYFSRPGAKEDIARDYYSVPLAELQRGSEAASGDDFQQGMIAFNKGEWAQAASAFEKVAKTHASYEQARYYLGHAHFNDNRLDKAREIFSAVADEESQYAPLAMWNLALTDLLTQHEGEAMLILESIAKNPDHFYQKKASELLDELK